MPEASGDYLVAVFGAGGVGKTSIVTRFITGDYNDTYVPTVEDTYTKVICCNNLTNVCTMQITDTTGSHQFPAMQRLSMSRANAFILVYSIDKEDSFAALLPIIQEIRSIKDDILEQTPIMLVGNKLDAESNRKVTTTRGQKQAKVWTAGFIETSAKNNTNITELFEQLLSLEQRRHLSLQPEKEGKSGKSKKKSTEKGTPKKDSKATSTPAKKGKADEKATPSKKGKKNEENDTKKAGEKGKKGADKTDSGGPDDAQKKNCSVM